MVSIYDDREKKGTELQLGNIKVLKYFEYFCTSYHGFYLKWMQIKQVDKYIATVILMNQWIGIN